MGNGKSEMPSQKRRSPKKKRKAQKKRETRLNPRVWKDTGAYHRRTTLPADIERYYYDMACRGACYKYNRSVVDPWSGSAGVPLYDNLPTVKFTLRRTHTLTTDGTYGATGIALCPHSGTYHTWTPSSATGGAWSAAVALPQRTNIDQYSDIRVVSTGIRVSYIGSSIQNSGYGRFWTVPSGMGLPTDIDATMASTMSEWMVPGADYVWTQQGVDNSSEEYVPVGAAGAFTASGWPCFGFMFGSPDNLSKSLYRVDLIVNYEMIPFESSTVVGIQDGIVAATFTEQDSYSSPMREAIRRGAEGTKTLIQGVSQSVFEKDAVSKAHLMTEVAQATSAGDGEGLMEQAFSGLSSAVYSAIAGVGGSVALAAASRYGNRNRGIPRIQDSV